MSDHVSRINQATCHTGLPDATARVGRRALASVLLSLLATGPVFAGDELGFGSGSIATAVETKVEEQVEEQIIEQAEEQAVERVEELGFGSFQGKVEQFIEESVEETVEESVVDKVEDNLVEAVEERIEDSAAEQIDEAVADNIEESIEATVADAVEATISDSIEDSVAAAAQAQLESGVEQAVALEVEQQVELAAAGVTEEHLEGAIDNILENIETGFEVSEDRIHKGQWLVMAEPEVFRELEKEGYLFDNITELPGMGMWLADVAAPSSFDISAARQGVIDVVGSDRAEVDLNHIYTAGTMVASTAPGIAPRAALTIPQDTRSLQLRLGMIDSSVDLSHPSLADSHINSRSFVTPGAEQPSFHGTAIASIIAGSATDYLGLAPNSELFAAAVFEKDPQEGEIASTISLIKALDWLISSRVDVVNISLAGPPNRLLESALKRVAAQGVLVMAAAGNGGPSAKPMYPAAYDSVVAVTAVDARHRVFRLANRGDYLDLAAPGVDLLHARAGGGYTSSSGTSFAVPFAATAAARLLQLRPGQDAVAQLYASAEDLGPRGRDDVYGYGLLQLTAR